MNKSIFTKNLRAALALVVICCAFGTANAALFEPRSSGAWNGTTTWNMDGVSTTNIPGIGDDVSIKNFDVTIGNSYNALCNNLTIDAGRTLAFNGNSTSFKLTVNGNLTMNGTYVVDQTPAYCSITMRGANKTISGSTLSTQNFYYFTINLPNPTDVITLGANMKFGNGNNTPMLTLTSGILNAQGHTISFNKVYGITATSPSDFANPKLGCQFLETDPPSIEIITDGSGESDSRSSGSFSIYNYQATNTNGNRVFPYAGTTLTVWGTFNRRTTNTNCSNGTWYWGPNSNYIDAGSASNNPSGYNGANGAAKINGAANTNKLFPTLTTNPAAGTILDFQIVNSATNNSPLTVTGSNLLGTTLPYTITGADASNFTITGGASNGYITQTNGNIQVTFTPTDLVTDKIYTAILTICGGGLSAPITVTLTGQVLADCNQPETSLTVQAENTPVCYNTKTNIEVLQSESGVIYSLFIKGGTQVGVDITGDGNTISFPTEALTAQTTFVVKTSTDPSNTVCAPVQIGEDVIVDVSPASAVGTASTAFGSIAQGTANVTVTLASYTGAIVWQSSADGNDPWTPIDGQTTATLNLGTMNDIGNFYYRAVVTNSPCDPITSNIVHIEVLDPSFIDTDGYATCSGTNTDNLTEYWTIKSVGRNSYVFDDGNTPKFPKYGAANANNNNARWILVPLGTRYYIKNFATSNYFASGTDDGGSDYYFGWDGSSNFNSVNLVSNAVRDYDIVSTGNTNEYYINGSMWGDRRICAINGVSSGNSVAYITGVMASGQGMGTDNNWRFEIIHYPIAKYPDIIVSNITLDQSVVVLDSAITGTVQIQNIAPNGAVAAGTPIRIKLAFNTQFFYVNYTDGLAAGATADVPFSFTPLLVTDNSGATLSVLANSDYSIAELNCSNNIATTSAKVLNAVTVYAKRPTTWNQDLTIYYWTTENDGVWKDMSLIMSNDPEFGGMDCDWYKYVIPQGANVAFGNGLYLWDDSNDWDYTCDVGSIVSNSKYVIDENTSICNGHERHGYTNVSDVNYDETGLTIYARLPREGSDNWDWNGEGESEQLYIKYTPAICGDGEYTKMNLVKFECVSGSSADNEIWFQYIIHQDTASFVISPFADGGSGAWDTTYTSSWNGNPTKEIFSILENYGEGLPRILTDATLPDGCTPTGIDTPQPAIQDVVVYSDNRQIFVAGVENFKVYNITGREVANSNLLSGVYIVKIGNKAYKAIVR